MFLTIHDVVALSGLSRAQIDLLISRHGVAVRGRAAPGEGRRFVKADALRFAIAGELARLGLNQPRISDALASLKGLTNDLHAHMADISSPQIVLSVDAAGNLAADVVDACKHAPCLRMSIVIDARPLLARIERQIAGASA
ncbi:hypothetical protein [Kaistia sp. MMO-174]|uniref:hypothetical protein n=1 Tax=Kaistia sp. MMO-174 TaxID=3081256 RepID=UPI003019ABF0